MGKDAKTRPAEGVEFDPVPAIEPTATSSTPAPASRVRAVCPRNKAHDGARVYKTMGRTRYCCCDTCGENWKQAGPYSDPLREYVLEYCDSVDAGVATPTEVNGKSCVLLPVESALKLTRRLRELVKE